MSSDTYRLLVQSSQRLSGHPYDFLYDASRITTSRDFVGTTWMVAVEWCDAVTYSEYEPDFSASINHPSCLLLQSPTFAQTNAFESWSGAGSSTLAVLQSYVSTGTYGVTADSPYVTRRTLGGVVQGDMLNQLGHIRFQIQQGPGADNGGGVAPCLAPGPDAFGGDYSFSLVFWRVPDLTIETPPAPYCDVFRMFLASSDRVSGSAADCVIPVGTGSSTAVMHGKWEVVVESWGQLKHEAVSLARGWVLRSDTFSDPNSNSRALAAFPRTRVAGATNEFGLRLSTKPPSRDTIGVPVRCPLGSLHAVHLTIVDAVSGDPIDDPALLEEWLLCLTFYRVG